MKGYQELPFDEVWVSLNKKLNMLLNISLMKSLLYKVALKIINFYNGLFKIILNVWNIIEVEMNEQFLNS